MKQLIIASAILTTTSMSALAQTVPSPRSLSEQLVGTWVSNSVTDVYEDGHVANSWGSDVKAAVNFDGQGHYILTIIGAELYPSQPMETPPRAKRPVVVTFGTYTVDDAASTVTYTADRASDPILETARTASMKLNDNELEQTSAPVKGPQGTFRPHYVWKRAH